MNKLIYIFQKARYNNVRSFLLLFLLFTSASSTLAQTIQGYVYDKSESGEKEPLVGVNVYLSDSYNGAITNNEGFFEIKDKANQNAFLIASLIGYTSDSIKVSDINGNDEIEFILSDGITLTEAVVETRRKGSILPRLTPLKTELITTAGLQKMACCNLSESFENSASITVGYTDAVSGAKQVQLLGLSSVYSQITDENIPALRGLSSTYGWSYIPGPWLESVQISKGASSVVNGYESISGQINVEHKKPNLSESLFINLYADEAKRIEANITSAAQVSKKWWVGFLAHGSLEKKAHDDNHDTFMDVPKMELANIYNRWLYIDDERGIQSRFGIKFLHEKRDGGQIASKLEPNQRAYETHIKNNNFNVYNKTGIAIGDKEGQSLGIINSFTYHKQNSGFGDRTYNGEQQSFYSNILFSSDLGNPRHKYTTGLSFVYDNYETEFEDKLPYNQTPLTAINREEITPGMFGEYTYSFNDKFVFIAGMRVDHNSKYGWLFTPRSNIRYNLSENIVFRLSAGRGYRSANAIAENIGLLASSRLIDVMGVNNLDIEKAWNYGANATFYIPIWQGETATLSFDYFRTDFQNQVVVDMDRGKNNVFFYNLNGSSYANAFQVDLSLTMLPGFDLFAAFRLNDTRVTYSDGENKVKMEKPLTSRYRGLINLSYATRLKKWVFDATAQLNGPARIPGMNGYQSEKQTSKAFPVFFAQVTKNSKRFDIYLGVENIFNYKQKNPILNSDDAFGKNFDSSLVWGPLMGRKIYGGIRWRIGKL